MYTITATEKGQIVIPAEIRAKLKIKKGTKFYVGVQGATITLRPATPEYIDSLVGVLGGGGDITGLLLEERAAETKMMKAKAKKWKR